METRKGDPPPPYKPPADDGGEEPDQETRDVHTQTEMIKSQARSESARKTTDVSGQTFFTRLSSSSLVSSLTRAFFSTVSSSMPVDSTADLTDGSFLDYNLSIADAIAATLNELPCF